MTRPRIGAMFMGIVATLALATNVFATQPQPVTITVLTDILAGVGQVTSTSGIGCEGGIVSPGRGNFVGGQSFTHAQIIIVSRFQCEDGTFDLLVRVTLDFETFDTAGTWSVLNGTGAYGSLHGTGSLTGDSQGFGLILDTYVGSMHLD